jgi:hypothetical protein
MNIIPDPFGGIKQVAYVDTVELFFRGYLPRGIRERLRQIHGREPRTTPVKLHGFRLTVQKPSIAVLMELDRWQGRYNATVCRFDVAVDLLPEEPGQLERLNHLLRSHLILKWRTKGPMLDYDDRTYWVEQKSRKRSSKRHSNRDLLLYSDRPSKISGEPCAHLELRFHRTQACKREGVQRATDLVRLDPSKLFGKHIGWSDAGDRHAAKLIKRAVKEDQERYRGKTTNPLTDLYRASIARKVSSLLKRSGSDRAQSVKDQHPGMNIKMEGISMLHLPDQLTFGSAEAFVENIEYFQKSPPRCVIDMEGSISSKESNNCKVPRSSIQYGNRG